LSPAKDLSGACANAELAASKAASAAALNNLLMKATVVPPFIDKIAEGCNGDVTLEMNSNDGACVRFNLDQEMGAAVPGVS
jgi:hypothetical protein